MKVLFEIFGLPIYFFGTMIAIGMLGGILISYMEVRRKKLEYDRVFDLALYGIISAVVGARLFYIIFYNFSYYIKNPIEIFEISEGGLSIHGGLIGAFIFGWFYFRKHKLKFFKYADAIVPGIILGQGIGRVGCDVFGKVMTTPYLWGVERSGQILHPTQLYEFILNYIVFFILWRKRKSIRYEGQLFVWYLILFSINRSVVELFRHNPSVIGWFSISHLLSLVLIIGAFILMAILKQNRLVDIQENSANMNLVKKIVDWIKDIVITLILISISVVIYYVVQL